MQKNVISENRLRELVNESIYEVLNENEFDERIGHWLGNKFQTARNAVNNFINDFKAGQNDAREQNKDFNSYDVFGNRENDVRRMGNGSYPKYRYELEKSRNQQARGEDDSTTEPTNISNNNFQPHPSLSTQDNTNDDSTDNTTQNKRTEVQTRFNNGDYPKKPESWIRTPEPSDAVYGKRMAIRNLERAGIVPQNGDWNKPTGWKNVNGGGLTKAQHETIRTYNKFLYEEKLNELNKILNEIKTVRIKNK